MLFNAVNRNGPCGSQFCALQGRELDPAMALEEPSWAEKRGNASDRANGGSLRNCHDGISLRGCSGILARDGHSLSVRILRGCLK